MRLWPTAALALTGALCGCREQTPLMAAHPVETSPIPTSSNAAPRFVGRWAAAASACGHEAWRIDAAQLQSPGALSCSFGRVHTTDAGYTADGMCSVGKAAAPGRLVFTLTGPQRMNGLTINGGPFDEPIGLVRCPEPVQAAADPADSQG